MKQRTGAGGWLIIGICAACIVASSLGLAMIPRDPTVYLLLLVVFFLLIAQVFQR